MTLLPVEQQRIGNGLPGKAARNYWCAKPGCQHKATDRHHIIRRSHLHGDYERVEIDGIEHPNVIYLCSDHHRMITDNKAKLAWSGGIQGETSLLCWVPMNAFHEDQFGWIPLNPQPEITEGGEDINYANDATDASPSTPPSVCPTCDRRLPKPRVDWSDDSEMLQPKKGPSTFAVKIPEAERDHGSASLKDHMEFVKRYVELRGLEYGGKNALYFYLMAFFADLRQNLDHVVMEDAA